MARLCKSKTKKHYTHEHRFENHSHNIISYYMKTSNSEYLRAYNYNATESTLKPFSIVCLLCTKHNNMKNHVKCNKIRHFNSNKFN